MSQFLQSTVSAIIISFLSAFLGARYVRQPLHGGALVVGCKVRVMTRDCRAFVPYRLTRHEVGDTRCFHRDGPLAIICNQPMQSRGRSSAQKPVGCSE